LVEYDLNSTAAALLRMRQKDVPIIARMTELYEVGSKELSMEITRF